MSYETISCRMSRSDPSIRWGFTVRSQGQDVVIATVERDSLADKAGLQNGDIVDQVAGRRCSGVADAQREIDGRATELNMNLRRFMSHPPAIPWSLHEGPDNKLHVQGFGTDINDGRSTSVSATSRSAWENPSLKATSPPAQNYSTKYETTNSSFSKSESTGGNAISATPIALPPPPGPGGNYNYQHHESSKTESKSATGPGVNPADNYNVSSRSEWSSGNPPPGFNGQMMPMLPFPAFPTGPNTQHYQHFESSKSESKTATGPGTTPADNYNVNSSTSWSSGNPPPNFNPNAPFGGGVFGNQGALRPLDSGFGASAGGFGSGASHGSHGGQGHGSHGSGGAPFGGSPYGGGGYGGGAGAGANSGYGSGGAGAGAGSGRRAQFAPDVNYNDQSYIQRGGAGQPSPFQKARSLSPASKQRYQAPSPRTRRELSPGASVHHLQYNSPMNLYSTESAAEQYNQQTGLPVGPVPRANSPYLNSATRQAIAEEEGARFLRGTSPTCSPSFKRISSAVGTPVN